MARGTTLANVLLMVKGELGISLTSGVAAADDQELYTLIDNKQRWLSSEFDWPFLRRQADFTLVPGDRYLTIPTTINFERPVDVVTLWTNFWHPVLFGIDWPEYNALPSGDGGVPVFPLNPVQRWDWKQGDVDSFEIWPIPTQTQVLRFRGQAPLATLKSGTSFLPSNPLQLDDMMVALYVAAEKAATMKRMNAQALLQMADSRFNRIRASYNHRTQNVVFGAKELMPVKRVVPMVLVAGGS